MVGATCRAHARKPRQGGHVALFESDRVAVRGVMRVGFGSRIPALSPASPLRVSHGSEGVKAAATTAVK
jgi:hypothetical protein